MSHFAKVNSLNIVVSVISSEIKFINSGIVGNPSSWFKTSYNTKGNIHYLGGTPYRKNFAGVGFSYDSVRDAFIPPKPFLSWILNEDTCLWNAPIEYPKNGNCYLWNEPNLSWDLIETIN